MTRRPGVAFIGTVREEARNPGEGTPAAFALYPFTDDCNRIENGSQATNVPTPAGQQRPHPATAAGYSAQWGCNEQFQSGLLHFVWRIRDPNCPRLCLIREATGIWDRGAFAKFRLRLPGGPELGCGQTPSHSI